MLLVFEILVCLLFASIRPSNAVESVNITIADGDVQGQVNYTVRKNVPFYSFRGIPYAKPPVGSLRFASPQANDPWNGTLDATYDRSECPQFSSSTMYGEEDCLYINVYVPKYSSNSSVLVWIYGGSFTSGNSSYLAFGPDYFLEQDLVFVSFNYRLGALGFLSTEDSACPGNWGIKDQVLALKWVQKNIGYFGGDPTNVTIFGESAGSVSVHLLTQTSQTEGLFQRAIMNSGTTLDLWALNTRARTTAFKLGISFGIITTNSTTLINLLRTKSASDVLQRGLIAAQALFATNALRGLPFAPVLEPNIDGAVYVNSSDTALRKGNFHKVPMLMGFNSQEAVSAGDLATLLKLYLIGYDLNINLLPPWNLTQNTVNKYNAGLKIKNHYFSGLTLSLSSTQDMIEFISADQFNRPIRRAGTDMSNYTTVYFYEFGYQGNVSYDGTRTYEGTGHAEDINYLFRSYNNYSEVDVKVSEMLVLLWSNFAKFGNPTPYEAEALNYTIWKPVDPSSTNFTYMSLNASMLAGVNPKQEDYEFYSNIFETYGDINDVLSTY